MPPHQFWPRYHSDGLSPVHVHFEFFSKQICNVEALICHFYKNTKTLTQIHFPRDAHIFRTCTIFYRHYKGLHQMRKDLVLCTLPQNRVQVTFWIKLIFGIIVRSTLSALIWYQNQGHMPPTFWDIMTKWFLWKCNFEKTAFKVSYSYSFGYDRLQ